MGNDFEHLGYREYFASKHVNVDNVFVAGNKTPVYVAFRFGDKNYLFYKPSQPSENELVRLREHFVKHTLASAARIVYCALSSDQLVMEIFKHARQNGKKNAWNPILFSPNPHETKSTLNITDYLFINEVEEEQLVELTKANVSRFYQRHGISVICVTLGERGCRLINKGAVSTIPSTKVEQVFNTTGAGDAFAGAFLGAIALRSFDSIDECAKNASRVAAEVITRQGR
jgi:sugar/nucleoside kinase (ribokinase family)